MGGWAPPRRARRALLLVATLGTLIATPIVVARPAGASCPTTHDGRYLGTWASISGFGGVGAIDATFTASTFSGTVDFTTGTTVLLPGSAITGTISCGHVTASSGPVSFVGDLSPSGTELAGTYSYSSDSGTWHTGLVTDQTTVTGTSASTSGGTTTADPLGVAVASPAAGTITIQEALATGGSLAGYSLFDTVVRIDAPSATASTPLQLTFTIDGSATGGTPAAAVVVFRNGILVGSCTGAPQAIPDPCVSQRTDMPGGGVQLTVLTSHASTWAMGALPVADATPPVITPNVSGASGSNGWYVGDVTVAWSVTDPDSAITSTAGCGSRQLVTDTAGASFTCTATSHGGTATQTVTISRDATAPSLAPSVLPNPSIVGAIVTASPNASDALSGMAVSSCDAVDTATVGSKTVSCSGQDLAGNGATGSASYDVVYGFVGFGAPVDNGGVLNQVKATRTVPLKWRLVDAAGNGVTTLTSVVVRAASLSCPAGVTVDQVEELAAGASGLQNLGNGYYQVNWKTPSTYAGSCKTVSLDLGDGATHAALFQFTP